MEPYREQLIRIKEILKINPRGITVTDISKALNINRNSVAKYLDLMLISGQVEMKAFGPAKVFFLSQRLPISSLLDLTSDYILLLNDSLNVTQASSNTKDFTGIELDELIGQNIDSIASPLPDSADLKQQIENALAGERTSLELNYQKNDRTLYLETRFTSIAFEDGTNGVAIVLKDVTSQKHLEKLQKSKK
ncbi:MAG: PAS domain S-box protein [Candidatus Heimdallarchaeota archaeon]